MGHMIDNTDRMFRMVNYNTKNSDEIRTAIVDKKQELALLITERGVRVDRLCDEYDITAERLTDLILQYQNSDRGFVSYQNQGGDSKRIVPAGVIANIIREKEMVESERSQAQKLDLVLRNLRDTEKYTNPHSGKVRVRECIHELTDHELEYLGF